MSPASFQTAPSRDILFNYLLYPLQQNILYTGYNCMSITFFIFLQIILSNFPFSHLPLSIFLRTFSCILPHFPCYSKLHFHQPYLSALPYVFITLTTFIHIFQSPFPPSFFFWLLFYYCTHYFSKTPHSITTIHPPAFSFIIIPEFAVAYILIK